MADSKEDTKNQETPEETNGTETGVESGSGTGQETENSGNDKDLIGLIKNAGLEKDLETYVQSIADKRVTDAIKTHDKKQKDKQRKDAEAKEKTRRLIKELVRQFINRHGSIICKTLLDVDISTDEGMEAANEKGLFETHCPKFVRDAAEILENLIE